MSNTEMTTPAPAPVTPDSEAESSEPMLQSFIIRRYRWAYLLVWTFVLGMLLLIAWQSGTATTDLNSYLSITGKVTARSADTATTEDNSTPVYTVTFEYDADPGKAMSAQTLTWEVSSDFYTAHPEDSLITLYLDPNQPDRILLEPPTNTSSTTRLLLGGGLLLLILTLRLGVDIYARRRYA